VGEGERSCRVDERPASNSRRADERWIWTVAPGLLAARSSQCLPRRGATAKLEVRKRARTTSRCSELGRTPPHSGRPTDDFTTAQAGTVLARPAVLAPTPGGAESVDANSSSRLPGRARHQQLAPPGRGPARDVASQVTSRNRSRSGQLATQARCGTLSRLHALSSPYIPRSGRLPGSCRSCRRVRVEGLHRFPVPVAILTPWTRDATVNLAGRFPGCDRAGAVDRGQEGRAGRSWRGGHPGRAGQGLSRSGAEGKAKPGAGALRQREVHVPGGRRLPPMWRRRLTPPLHATSAQPSRDHA
jgi:hypothetical protein